MLISVEWNEWKIRRKGTHTERYSPNCRIFNQGYNDSFWTKECVFYRMNRNKMSTDKHIFLNLASLQSIIVQFRENFVLFTPLRSCIKRQAVSLFTLLAQTFDIHVMTSWNRRSAQSTISFHILMFNISVPTSVKHNFFNETWWCNDQASLWEMCFRECGCR